jgi:hypothetical protein
MGVYNDRHRTLFQDVSISLNLLAGDTPTTVGAALIALKAKNTIFVQRIAVHVRTAAAQALTFQDNNGTPKVIAVLPASATAGDVHVLLDEPEGVPLTEGKQLDLIGTAGVAATITITAYRQPTGTRTMAEV